MSDLDILVSQIEISSHKTIIYHKCNHCNDPILITIMWENGEQCTNCKKWYCTKQYINESEYINSCSYKYLSTYTEVYINSENELDEDTEYICLNCIKDLIYKNDESQFCKHILNYATIMKGRKIPIIYENEEYNCDICDAANHITINL